MDVYARAISQIIKEQEIVIGPLALAQARKVDGLEISSIDAMKIAGDPKETLIKLVKQYEQLFGQASIEVCKDAIREMKPPIPVDQLPDLLK